MGGDAFDPTDAEPLALREPRVSPVWDPPSLDHGEAIRIATAVPVPDGAKAVLRREAAAVDGDTSWGQAIGPGTNTDDAGGSWGALRGRRAVLGETPFPSAKEARETVSVYERLSIGRLATGTESPEGRESDLDCPMLAALVRSWGHAATSEGRVPDECDRVRRPLIELAERHAIVLTTGGTSVGTMDHVIAASSELGDVLVHRVAVRPGNPIAVARRPDNDAVGIAIPGTPIGAHTSAAMAARPFLRALGAAAGGGGLPRTRRRRRSLWIPVRRCGDGRRGRGDGAGPSRFGASRLRCDVRSKHALREHPASRIDGFVVTEIGLDAGEAVAVVPDHGLE